MTSGLRIKRSVRVHGVVILDETLHSHSVILHVRVYQGIGKFNVAVTLR